MSSYVTVDDFKKYLKSNRGADVGDDSVLSGAIAAASEAIDDYCQRSFVVAGAESPRSYVPTGWDVLRIHDCTSISSITALGVTLASTRYQTEPLLSWTGAARPIEQVRFLRGYWLVTVPDAATVVVTATWGWPATPVRVVEACKILAKDIAANRDVNFGIAGFTDYAGVRAKENPQVTALLDRLRRPEAFGIA